MLTEAEKKVKVDTLTARIGYTFKNPDLLIQALTRRSAKGVHVPTSAQDFEPLEFSGDRALNFALSIRLRQLYPRAKPAELQNLYVGFTRNSDETKTHGGPLYRVAKAWDMEKHLIKDDTEDLAAHGERGPRLTTKKKTREGHLSDHVEAILGAISEDCFPNMQPILDVVNRFWASMGLNEDAVSQSSFGKSHISGAGSEESIPQAVVRQNQIFLEACRSGNFQNAKIAIDNGAQVSTVDEKGFTALHYFAMHGSGHAVAYLLETLQFDVDAADNKGATALVYAGLKGTPTVFESLLKAGASPGVEFKVQVSKGKAITLLWISALQGYTNLVSLLSKYGWESFSEEQIDSAIEVSRPNITPALEKLKKTIVWNAELFSALNEMLADPANVETGLAAVKSAIKNGANIYAVNQQSQTVFGLISQLPVVHRYNVLVEFLGGKLKFGEMDFSAMFTGLMPDNREAVAPLTSKLSSFAGRLSDADAEIVEAWVDEISAAVNPGLMLDDSAPMFPAPAGPFVSLGGWGAGGSGSAGQGSTASKMQGTSRPGVN